VAALTEAIYRDAGKPNAAVPVTNECGEPTAFTPGSAYQVGPFPIPTLDGALYLALEIIRPDNFHAAGTIPAGTYQWRNQADGFFESGACTDTKTVQARATPDSTGFACQVQLGGEYE
jgi:hypothetical protein